MANPAAVRRSGRWKQLAASTVAAARAGNRPCAICGGLILWDASPRTRLAPAVDHVEPLSLGGNPFDVANLQVTHFGCNGGKGGLRRRRRRVSAQSAMSRADRADHVHAWLDNCTDPKCPQCARARRATEAWIAAQRGVTQ